MMKKGLDITCAAGLVMLFSGLAWAMNSLVGPDGLNKMKQANIGNEVIQMLVAEQTCSITGESLVRLKKAGADDETLKSVILADRYKNPKKANLSVEQMNILRKAGYSDETIMQLLHLTPTTRVVDQQGHESVVYGTRLPPEPKPTASTPAHFDLPPVIIKKVEPSLR
jgi:hypothetical protein